MKPRNVSRKWKGNENNYPESLIENARCPNCGVKAVLCGGCGMCRACCGL